jgi:PhzF family phenazine biosynthesis protein
VTTFHLVDAFASTAFTGNPAGVVVLEDRQALDPRWAARVAGEVRVSETAFVQRTDGEFTLRWWTPTTEVELCGHATLASAHVLWERGIVPCDQAIRFSTRSGQLTCRSDGGLIAMDLPAWPVHEHPEPDMLQPALAGTPGRYLGRSVGTAGDGGQRYDVVELADEPAVRRFEPDLAAVVALGAEALVVTAPADGPDDLVSRTFLPRFGIDEDPVTGSSHAVLGPLWAARLGRTDLTARQLSSRGGWVRVRVAGARVEVAGRAVTVVSGGFSAPATS